MSEQDTRELRNCGTAEGNAPVPESDTREQLEADLREWIDIATYKNFTPKRMLEVMLHWLDRQAAITSSEWCWSNDALEEELTRKEPEIAELTAERDQLREALDACGTGTMYELWRRDHAQLEAIRAALHDKPGT